jgi:hypothetical protein
MDNQFKPWFAIISNCTVAPIEEDLLPKGAIFGFKFPNTFSGKQSWLAGDTTNVATVYFFPENLARIIAKGGSKETTWLMAYNHIARSTHGPKVVPEPVSIDTILPLQVKINERLNAWIKMLNALPFVTAKIAEPAETGSTSIISIWIPDSWSNIAIMIGSDKLGVSKASFKDDGVVNWYGSDDETGVIKDYSGREYSTWQNFYEALVEYLNTLLKPLPEPSVGIILDQTGIEKLNESVEMREQRISLWIKAFNSIPGIQASRGDYPDQAITIVVPVNANYLIGGESEHDDYHLLIDGTCEEAGYNDAESVPLYDKWKPEDGGDWSDFYLKVIALSKLYTESVPEAPIPVVG